MASTDLAYEWHIHIQHHHSSVLALLHTRVYGKLVSTSCLAVFLQQLIRVRECLKLKLFESLKLFV